MSAGIKEQYNNLDFQNQLGIYNAFWNPRTDDPTGADLVPFIPWTNTTEGVVKYFDGTSVLIVQTQAAPPAGLWYVLDSVGTLPANASAGDAYLLSASNSQSDYVALFDGSDWEYFAPEDVRVLYHAELDFIYEYEDQEWTPKISDKIKATADTTFYIDSVNGNNANDGLSPSFAFLTPQAAIAKVALCYDFGNTFKVTFSVESSVNDWSQINLVKIDGTTDFKYITWEGNGNLVNSQSGNLFTVRDGAYEFKNFVFSGTSIAVNKSFVYAIRGIVNLADLTFKGFVTQPVIIARDSELYSSDLILEDLECNYIFLATERTKVRIAGDITAKGTIDVNSAIFDARGNASIIAIASMSFVLEAGATVTSGWAVVLRNLSSIDLAGRGIDTIWGLEKALIYGNSTFNGAPASQKYNYLMDGCEVSIDASDTKILNIADGELFYYVASASAPSSRLYSLASSSIEFPSILQSSKIAYLYYNFTLDDFEFRAGIGLPEILTNRVQLAEVRSNDGVNFTSVFSCVRGGEPSGLAVLKQSRGLANRDLVSLQVFNNTPPQFSFTGGYVCAVGYSENDLIDLSQETAITYDLVDSTGAVVAADQQDWNFAIYEDMSNGSISNLIGNDASIRLVFRHPKEDKFVVLLGQTASASYVLALRIEQTYKPVIPGFLKNGGYLLINRIIASGNAINTTVSNAVGLV